MVKTWALFHIDTHWSVGGKGDLFSRYKNVEPNANAKSSRNKYAQNGIDIS